MGGAGLVATLLPPRRPSVVVGRPEVEARLGPDTGASWTLVVGPPGAGKTTLVRAWLDDRSDAWAWVGMAAAPTRRVGIGRLVVRGVQHGRPRPLDLLDALDMDGVDDLELLTRLVDELAADAPGTATTLLVIDDVHLLSADEWSAMRVLLGTLPPTLHVVLVGRSDPPIPLGRERATGRMTEVRAKHLEFALDDTAALLAAITGDDRPALALAVQARTEGWVAGVRLVALAIRDGADPDELLRRLAAADTSVAEFLVEEVLDRLSHDRRELLMAASILDVLDPDLCDALADRRDSADLLAGLAADGLFVAPLDHGGPQYRFHPLLAELLRHQLDRRDRDARRELHRRAGEWLVERDRSIDAIEHLVLAGDHARAHRLVVDFFRPLYVGAHRRDLDRWLAAVPEDVVCSSLHRAVDHCAALAMIAHPDGLRWWAWCSERVEPGDDWAASRLASVLALYCAVNGDLPGLHHHREEAERRRPTDWTEPLDEILSSWDARLQAVLGDPAAAVAAARRLVASPRELVPDASALSVLAGALLAAGEDEPAVRAAQRAIDRWRAAGEPELPGMVDALVVAASTARGSGDLTLAESYVESALTLPPVRSAPHLLIALALVERAWCRHARGDASGRADLLALADDLRLAAVPPPVAEWVDDQLGRMERSACPPAPALLGDPPSTARSPAFAGDLVEQLTEREMAVLQLLPSHLSLPEIGTELYISRHTVKAHVSRIYRKLGAQSRSGAIREAVRHGLL